MSEKPKAPFNMKKAALAAGVVVAGGAYLLGQAANNADHQADREENAAEQQAKVEAFHDSIEAAINAEYDRRQVVGEIHVEQGMNLIGEAEGILKDSLGEDVYDENRAHLYNYLQGSAQQYIANPGETFYVVETEMDGNKENGSEYIVTDGSGGIIVKDDIIPSPETSS